METELTLGPMVLLKGHESPVNCIAADDNFIYSAASDQTVKVWSIETGYCTSSFQAHQSPVESLVLHNGVLFSCDSGGEIKSWDTQKQRVINSFVGHTKRITSFGVDKNDRLFSGSADCSVKLWNVHEGTLKQNFLGHSDYITKLISDINTNTLYSASIDKSVIAWDVETGSKKHVFSGHADWIFCMQHDPEKKILYTGSRDKTIKLWDTRTGKNFHSLFGHEYAVIQLCLYKNLLYTASWDGRVGVYNLKKLKKMPIFLPGHNGKIRCIQRYDDLLYTGGNDNKIKVWSLKKNKCKAVLKGHSSPIRSILTPNKNITLSCAEDPTIIRWPSSHILSTKSTTKFKKLIKKQTEELELNRNHSYDLGSKAGGSHDVKIIIDGETFTVNSKFNMLEACRNVGFDIAALCYHPSLGPVGTCKCCVVEIKNNNSSNFSSACACATDIWDGLEIRTDSPSIRQQLMSALAELRLRQKNRKLVMKMVGNHDTRGNSRLNKYIGMGEKKLRLKKKINQQNEDYDEEVESLLEDLIEKVSNKFIDNSNHAIQVDHTKCIDCTRCVKVCSNIQGMNVYSAIATLPDSLMPAFNTRGKFLNESMCISCGQCSLYCPSGAITEIDQSEKVDLILKSRKKLVVVGIAPSCRLTMAELFKLQPGSLTTGQCVHLLRLIGFHKVFDVQFTADLTIMEEGTELLHRLTDPKAITPMFTSCCPGWVNMVEKQYPKLIPHLSSCRSPQQMFGSVIKNYYAKKIKVAQHDIFCVTIMPCTAKKSELLRTQFRNEKTKIRDVDLTLTVRELGRMIKRRGIELSQLEERDFDNPLGSSSGSAQLFAATGGVMEAALRSAYWLKTSETFPKLKFQPVRGLEEIKEASLDFDGRQLRIAIVSGGKNIHKFLEPWGTSAFNYDFIEIMACPGGCIGGGGQPRSNQQILPLRIKSVYNREESIITRASHENPQIKKLYQDWLKKPYGEKAIQYLHTTYEPFKFTTESLKDTKSKYFENNHGLNAKNSLLILFGSQTGTAQKAAEKIAHSIAKINKKVRIMEMNQYEHPINLKNEKLVIFVTSTFWDGSFPENAVQFFNQLKNLQPMSLNKLQYCAFGLGSTSYTRFNNAIKLIDAKLRELGASQVLPIGLSNREDKNGYASTLNPWIKNLHIKLRKNFRRQWK
ncbi:iron hydrogenase [Anaeramoeba flamelloides]|uniref:Iron hydrogenase n=1 Tax=Anaeramoeba flamelloides TaxID=1746091 RepID=A0AAV7YTL3_9EUKA|nr:iron hydrogenase [Anaeramoeba flamelloides]